MTRALGRSRTYNRRIRNPAFYPVELRALNHVLNLYRIIRAESCKNFNFFFGKQKGPDSSWTPVI